LGITTHILNKYYIILHFRSLHKIKDILGKDAFRDCTSIEKVNLSHLFLSDIIPSGVFAGCKNLKEVLIPSNIEFVSKYAFADCESLESIIISDTTVLAPGTFDYIECIEEIKIEGGRQLKVRYKKPENNVEIDETEN